MLHQGRGRMNTSATLIWDSCHSVRLEQRYFDDKHSDSWRVTLEQTRGMFQCQAYFILFSDLEIYQRINVSGFLYLNNILLFEQKREVIYSTVEKHFWCFLFPSSYIICTPGLMQILVWCSHEWWHTVEYISVRNCHDFF